MVRRWVAVTALIFAVVVVINLALIPVYLRKSKTKPTTNSVAELIDASLNTLSVYPDGSYSAKMSEFTQLTEENYSFLPLNRTLLNELSKIDNSSFVFEAGRQQFLYFRIPDELVVQQRSAHSLSGIGIHFGQQTDSLNIVPILDEQQSSPGVSIIPTNLPDRSRLLRIEITTMPTMCSQPGIADSCTSVDYNAYLIFDKTQLSTWSVTYQASVACGDICSTLSSYSACAVSCGSQCDGDQVAGADTPVTRRYNLGRRNVQFKFQYETYSVRDRIKVWNDINLLFDSECVGTSGVRTKYLVLSNKTNVRVDVEPNCGCQSLSGCTGTLWHFTVVCPEVCPVENHRADTSSAVKLSSEGRIVTNGATLYITDEAIMPSLVASSCEPVTWEVLFSYQAAFPGALSFSKKVTGQSSDSTSYDIIGSLQNETIGGIVTAKWIVVSTKTSGEIKFNILGTQPAKRTIMTYIDSRSSFWYAKNIAAQESSGGQQFSIDRYPLFSSAHDNGYGIYQITNPTPTYNEVWNWKANVDAGIRIINQKTTAAISWMANQRQQAKQETGREQPVDDEQMPSL
ncbi:unnamed protein product [Adineta ricciae]|uniref:Uncharacterized protein n=1 Tax=Adineta ricciae TaxID=249248 RepID=A0A815WYU7_ADIRI|nr:unnamed protein product [Adineta ricciae]